MMVEAALWKIFERLLSGRWPALLPDKLAGVNSYVRFPKFGNETDFCPSAVFCGGAVADEELYSS